MLAIYLIVIAVLLFGRPACSESRRHDAAASRVLAARRRAIAGARCRAAASRRRYYVTLLVPFFAYAIALLGFNLLFGYTGLLSFGHAMFLGLGAYGAAVIAGMLGITQLRAGAGRSSALAAVVVALPIGLLCVRYTGIFFGMLTLAFGMLFHSFLFKFYHLTGGDSGMRVPRMTLLGLEFDAATTRSSSWSGPFYYYCLALLVRRRRS